MKGTLDFEDEILNEISEIHKHDYFNSILNEGGGDILSPNNSVMKELNHIINDQT